MLTGSTSPKKKRRFSVECRDCKLFLMDFQKCQRKTEFKTQKKHRSCQLTNATTRVRLQPPSSLSPPPPSGRTESWDQLRREICGAPEAKGTTHPVEEVHGDESWCRFRLKVDSVPTVPHSRIGSMYLSLHFCLEGASLPALPPSLPHFSHHVVQVDPTRPLKTPSLLSEKRLSDDLTAMQSKQNNTEVSQVQQGPPDTHARAGRKHPGYLL